MAAQYTVRRLDCSVGRSLAWSVGRESSHPPMVVEQAVRLPTCRSIRRADGRRKEVEKMVKAKATEGEVRRNGNVTLRERTSSPCCTKHSRVVFRSVGSVPLVHLMNDRRRKRERRERERELKTFAMTNCLVARLAEQRINPLPICTCQTHQKYSFISEA